MPRLPYIDKEHSSIESPHVVILGAGASLAACPRGDRDGRPLPLMRNLVDVCGLTDMIAAAGLDPEVDDFEAFYSMVNAQRRLRALREEIDDSIFRYFSILHLPDRPTVYDYLVLSLREKDLIASFNWDPLLMQAYRRNLPAKPLPGVVFLHGCVALGVCHRDKRLGYLGSACEVCRAPLARVRLLYPTTQKNYNKDPVIREQWKRLTHNLENCYFLTIFGYSAPKTDVEARRLMHAAWSANKSVELAQVEILDVKDRTEIEQSWREFTEDYHYGIGSEFSHSWLRQFPRQTCEALFDATMQNDPRQPTPFPEAETLKQLHTFIAQMKIEPLH